MVLCRSREVSVVERVRRGGRDTGGRSVPGQMHRITWPVAESSVIVFTRRMGGVHGDVVKIGIRHDIGLRRRGSGIGPCVVDEG